MKLPILLLCLSVLSSSGLVHLAKNCPEQFVPNSDNICIRPSYIEACETYKNSNECAVCSKGYDLIDGKCTLSTDTAQSSNILVGCLTSEAGKCLNCANGFRKENGHCLKGVQFCDTYDDKARCIRCDKEYSLIFGECRHNQMLGCKIEQADHSCLECHKPYTLQNFQCVIPNCKTYNDYGCVACECGFFMNENRVCQKMQNGCLKYYRGICVECLPHFKLKGGVCAIDGCLMHTQGLCSVCKDGYDLVEGTCRFKNCFDWHEDRCLICEAGFNLQQGRCVATNKKYVCDG